MGILTGILRPNGLKGGRSSSPYTFKNTASLTSGSIINFDLELALGGFTCPAAAKEYQGFMPFKNCSTFNNNVDNSIEFIRNNSPEHAVTVTNRGAQDLGDLEVMRFQVKNIGTGTIAPNDIVVTLWNE